MCDSVCDERIKQRPMFSFKINIKQQSAHNIWKAAKKEVQRAKL